jgi:hypothetical protein
VRIALVLISILILPASSLSVWTGSRWESWWHSGEAPAKWTAQHPALARSIHWRSVAAGVEWTEVRIAGSGEATRIKVIIARIAPGAVRFRLDTAFNRERIRAAWSVTRAPDDAVLAINAGQFPRARPWGWVVLDGREYQPARPGPLSVGIGFDSSGCLHWIPADSLLAGRSVAGLAAGFQSFPRLLQDGVVPDPLREEGRGVDLVHRDARAALGQTADGSVLLVLTRFDGAAGAFDYLPFGLTVPEMTAIMGALGARDAVMLDGGISSQLLIRERDAVRRWRGLRAVPMGLVVTLP